MRLSYPIPKSTLLNIRRGIVLRVTGINCQMHDSIVPRVHHSLIVAFSIGVLCFFSRMFLYFPHFPTTQCTNCTNGSKEGHDELKNAKMIAGSLVGALGLVLIMMTIFIICRRKSSNQLTSNSGNR